MSVPAAALRVTQIGVESTRGTAVPANRLLNATSFEVSPEFEGRQRLSQLGSLVPTTIQPGVELSSARLSGTLSFTDLAYLFSAFYGSVTASQVMDGATPTGAYQRVWSPAARSFTDPLPLTVETGYAGQAVFRAAGVSLTSLSLSVEPQNVAVEGSALGSKLETVSNFTASPTTIADVLPLYDLSEVRVATTQSGLDSASPLAAAFSGSLNFGERMTRAFPIGLDQIYLVPQAHEPELQLTLALNSEGLGQLSALRQNQSAYVRLLFQGPVIYSGGITVRHELQIDVALKWLTWSMADAQGIGVTPLTGAVVQDPTWGRHIEVTLTTTVNTL